ncbi:MAG: hypothetical protein K0S20_301 [Patescibacteria group bacterium]|nr:hypothetical protein [Patescibacteria group bacterium]
MNTDHLGFTTDLPIHDFREQILSSIDNNQVTIITAETGAGKSTQVPQYLAEHGYEKVVVTQPRILAARNLSIRVREEVALRTGQEWGDYVAYRTSYERDDTEDTVILYCTDGLQLVREITGSGTTEKQVLLLDEIHEWNENMEVLIAWAKKRCQEDKQFKVAIMSATIEANNLATYFGAGMPITVPGRSYKITKRRADDLVDEIEEQIDVGGRNMLVFLPGKAEIENVAEALKRKAESKGIPIIPLHSQLEASAQQEAFEPYPNGKVILSTNIAQTSVTIDDIDIVIDSGLERRSEVQNGVEGLFISEVSQADCLQRAGRAGRTKEGEYVLAPFDQMPCADFNDRPAYAIPEILRKHIDRLALRLANVGMDIEVLEFYHSPSKKAIKNAKLKLLNLGAMTPDGDVTDIGRKMEKFPVESSYARMLVEARQHEESVQAKLAAIIAIQEVGGIVKGGVRYSGWRRFTKQTESDLLAQYDVYLAFPNINPEEHEELGIIAKNVLKAQDVLNRLSNDLGIDTSDLTPIEKSEEVHLLRSIVAGQIDQLWLVEGRQATHLVTQKWRELSGSTVVSRPALIVGTPFDLQIPTSKGLEVLNLVQDVTTVDPRWLKSFAPHLFKVQPGKVYLDRDQGCLVTQWFIEVGKDTLVEGVTTPVLEKTSHNSRLFAELYSARLHDQLENERSTLQKMYGQRIATVPLPHVTEQVKEVLEGAISIGELSKRQLSDLERLTKMQTYLGEGFMKKLLSSKRKGRKREEEGAKGWQPRHKRRRSGRR